jgi:outer membrane protein TolC
LRYRSPQVFGVHRLSLAVTSLALTVFSAAAGCGLLDGQEPTASDAQEELEAKSSDAGNGPEARPAGAQKPAEDLPGLEEKKVRLELSLQVAVGIALKNNLDQRIGLLNRQIASRDVVIQRAVFDPYFNLDFTQSKNRDPTVNQLDLDPLNPITEVAVNPTNNQTYTAGIGGSTLFGTTYQLSLVENRFDSPETAVFSLNPRYSSTLRATITQPLLKNAWYAVNSANTRLAQNSLGAAGAQYTLSVMNTIYAVINAYWELVFAHRNYQAKIRASDLAQEQLRMDRQKVRVGTLPRMTTRSPYSRRPAMSFCFK